MRYIVCTLSFLFFSTLAFGQLDSNSITVTASRPVTLAPDEVVFRVNVDGPASTSLTDAVAALASLGISPANFSGVSSNQFLFITTQPGNVFPVPPAPPTIEWSFNLVRPLAQIKDTIATLSAMQKASAPSPLRVSFQLQGTQVSTTLAKSQICSIVDLIADARAKAQKFADSAGLNVGSILALSSSTVTQNASNVVVTNPFNLSGPDCSVTVKFAFGRYAQ